MRDIPDDILATLVRGRTRAQWPRLVATTDYAALADVDVVQICVPTPCTRNKEPDTSHIAAATRGIAEYGRSSQLAILRSTSYPGTTRELVRPILESHGRKVGEDIFLAFAPERIDPGRQDPPPRKIPLVVGGCDSISTHLTRLLFAQVVEKVFHVSSADAAEMTKLLENVFRNVNTALVNQFAILCDRMALDVWEIVEAAATKPYGFTVMVCVSQKLNSSLGVLLPRFSTSLGTLSRSFGKRLSAAKHKRNNPYLKSSATPLKESHLHC